MTNEELLTLLNTSGIPFRYHHFNKDTTPPIPRGVFMLDDATSVYADGITALLINNVRIELYTAIKDPETEQKLEKVLTNAEIPFDKVDEVYIEAEDMYMIVYEI